MSPASQGALEVERYIGSCLISSSVRSPVGGKSLIPGTAKKQQQEIVSFRGKQQRDYVQQTNYISSNEQCPYGTWAGAPLISMTSSPRRNNQRSSPPPCQNRQQLAQQQQGQQTQTHMQNQSPLSRLAIHTQGAPLILAGRFHNRGKLQSCNGMNGTSMNNSSTHILSTNVNVNATNYCNGNSVNVGSAIGNSIVSSGGKCMPIRGQRLADTAKKTQLQQQQQSQQSVTPKAECVNGKVDGTNIANIDSLSIASDESSGSNNSENSLPRIIKPRKRRKKDRKPTGSCVAVTENTAKTDEQPQQQQSQQSNQQQQQNHSNGIGISEHSSVVTLKPYVPASYETRYEQNRIHRRPPSIGKESYLRSQNQNISCNGTMQHMNHQQTNHQQQEIFDTRQQPHHQHHHHHHHQQQQQQLLLQQQQQRYAQRHAQAKMLDDNKNVIVPTTATSMLGRSIGLSSKGSIAGNTNYHHRTQPNVFHHHHHHHRQRNDARNGNNNNNANTAIGNGNGIVNTVPRQRFSQQHPSYLQNQQQSQHDYEPMTMGCEDSASLVDGPSGSLSSAGCQCRCCDPSGLIWDVDQNVYSPFLTPPHASEFPVTADYCASQQRQFAHLPLFLSRTGSAITCPEQRASNGCEYFELPESPTIAAQRGHNHNNRHRASRCVETAGATTCTSITGNSCNGQPTSAVTMLRRSWSDPTSYFSEEISAPSRDVGVIGDRGQTEITKGRSSWPGSSASGLVSGNSANSPYGNLSNSPISSQGLEVSTEIVTSPNGHRDLEIKFYSSSPSALPIENDKSAFIDDGEDFSDIWSYHESKLQQDFRTLLQAEE